MLERLVVDVVIQATGNHAHGVSAGIVSTLKRRGQLGRVFRPKAEWGDELPKNDDELYSYLGLPSSHVILFLGFDWHSQCLHATAKWRYRLMSAPVIKVAYCHETLMNGPQEEQEEKQAIFARAASTVDVIWHSGEREHSKIVELVGRPERVIYTPFAVDTEFFSCRRDLQSRSSRPFFRGKSTAFTSRNEYQERRDYLAQLTHANLIEVKPYDPVRFDDISLSDEYNDYRYCIDLPSVFDGPTTRVYEAISSGCIVYSHKRNFSEEEIAFYDGHLRTFDSVDDLVEQVSSLPDSDRAAPSIQQWTNNITALYNRLSLDGTIDNVLNHIISSANTVYLSSPGVAVIDHEYHKKTSSQSFLLSDLFYNRNCHIYYDTMQQDKTIAYIPEHSAQWTVLWQCCHSDTAKALCDRSRQTIIFPMYDSSNHRSKADFPPSAQYFSFSETLHRKLRSFGLNSTLCTYFPEPRPTTELAFRNQNSKNGRTDVGISAYFWYRLPPIDLDFVSKFLRPLNISKLYVNVSPDPGFEINLRDLPSEIHSVPIEYITWLPTKDDLHRLLSNCLIYFAPRVCEGIGLSFLEAMSHGMCVVAPNYPTMNEYISHGRNGILYDLHNPLSDLEYNLTSLAEAAYEGIVVGRQKWLQQERRIMDIIDPLRSIPNLRELSEDVGVNFIKSANILSRLHYV